MAANVRTCIRVEGVVQGVGFRPFVYSLATRLGLAGWVGNDVDGVFAEVEGPAEHIRDFLAALERDAPPLARVERVSAQPMAPDGRPGFAIVASDTAGRRRALVSADSATCADCLRELADPADRRFGYPFINCTNCGPRFTIVRDVPYDRPLTTMAGFAMCAACAAEYHDPANRRFHAQPVCCPACGPRLALLAADGTQLSGPEGTPDGPLAGAVAALAGGQVLAVKGLGGYHLAVDAASEKAAALLRARKHREDKPFAVMVADLAGARALCEVDDLAAGLLTSPRRPIVLLPRRAAALDRPPGPRSPDRRARDREPGRDLLAAAVAPGNRQLGVMLPYTPLHHLLLRDFARPMVLTSGNVSDEPIAYRDEDALARLGGIADVFLTHDRPIHIRTDDSVVRPFRGREAVLRRSRGYVPEPLAVAARFGRPVLACGAELKNTFCLGREDRAFLSQHVGDLENYETLRSFTEGIGHFRRLFDVTPQIVAHDLHPDYLSTRYALEQDDCVLAGVQHHHAHIASCLADNGEAGPVIGVAFDGTGYGPDGTIWGGEFLLADLADAERAGHLAGVPMPGGAAAIRQPWRMAAAYLDAAFPAGLPGGLDVVARNQESLADRAHPRPPRDELSAYVQCGPAVRRGRRAAGPARRHQLRGPGRGRTGATGPHVTPRPIPGGHPGGRPFTVAGPDLVRAAAGDLLAGVPREIISARFHQGVAAMIGEACGLLRERSGLGTVALSGGVFQNLLLLGTVVDLLEGMGFRVLTHSRVPPNDGGISLGQAVVAAAWDRAGRLA